MVSAVSVLEHRRSALFSLDYFLPLVMRPSASYIFLSPFLKTSDGFRYKRRDSQSSIALSSSEGRKTTGCSHAFFSLAPMYSYVLHRNGRNQPEAFRCAGVMNRPSLLG